MIFGNSVTQDERGGEGMMQEHTRNDIHSGIKHLKHRISYPKSKHPPLDANETAPGIKHIYSSKIDQVCVS